MVTWEVNYSMSADVVIALSKGRLQEPSIKLFTAGGVQGLKLQRFVAGTWADCVLGNLNLGILLIRDDDVPTYVARGAADLGVVGKDVLDETTEEVVEILDLGFGQCRLSLAVPLDRQDGLSNGNIRRVATKYPRTAEQFFRTLSWQVQIIKLHGAVEIAPALGLSDAVVDLVSTGRTLKESGLVEVQVVKECSARLIGNRASFRLKSSGLKIVVDMLRGQLEAN
jgi:ATP phosphoribosyltransferase